MEYWTQENEYIYYYRVIKSFIAKEDKIIDEHIQNDLPLALEAFERRNCYLEQLSNMKFKVAHCSLCPLIFYVSNGYKKSGAGPLNEVQYEAVWQEVEHDLENKKLDLPDSLARLYKIHYEEALESALKKYQADKEAPKNGDLSLTRELLRDRGLPEPELTEEELHEKDEIKK
uniref:Uncharacterized protein n=1 Tax=Ditylenchus dipsaci TaxID=166011 RepID=A0A915CS32_9BILA